MKFKINSSAAAALGTLAAIARIFYGVTIDSVTSDRNGFLSVLFGGLLALPLAWIVRRSEQKHALLECLPTTARKVISLVLCTVFCVDAAIVSAEIAHSAGYAALERRSRLYLSLPHLLLCFWCLSLNGNAIGSAARLWRKLLAALLLIVIVLERKEYQLGWLFPILGNGFSSLFASALRVAGWLSMIPVLYLFAKPECTKDTKRFSPLRAIALSTVIAATLVLLRQMMTPSQWSEVAQSQSFQLDTLLSNGRAPLSLQLPMFTLWFISMLFSLLSNTLISASMLQQLLPSFNHRLCAAIVLVSVLALSTLGGLTQAFILSFCNWLFPILAIILVGCAILIFAKGENHASV